MKREYSISLRATSAAKILSFSAWSNSIKMFGLGEEAP